MQSFYVELLHGLGGRRAGDRLAQLREPTGRDQALLTDMGAAAPAHCVHALISHLLLRVGDGEPAPDQELRLTAGDRERILLAICARLLGAEADLVVSCPGCRELVELAVCFRDLIALRPSASADRHSLKARDGDWSAELLPPTGAALERALAQGPGAERRLLEDCLISLRDAQGRNVPATTLPPECEAELAEKLLALDPLAECRIALECPHCSVSFDTLLDGFALLKSALGGAEALYGDVYRMARAYHWSEADILALPLAKRARYLAIAAAAEAGQ